MDKRQITDTIVIHCTQTPKDMEVDVEKVTQWHKDRGFDTIGYHYIGWDGRNSFGDIIANGVYIYVIKASNSNQKTSFIGRCVKFQ